MMSEKKQVEKAVVSLTGKNHSGIVAKLSSVIAEYEGNFLDIQQTIVNEYFTMVFVVDISSLKCNFSEFKEHLLAAAEEIKVDLKVVHEGIFQAMHRI